jgi:hypothetical protein
MNSQRIFSNHYTLNALNMCGFWQLGTGAGGVPTTGEEWNVNTDATGCPINLSVGRDGTALSATHYVLFPMNGLNTSLDQLTPFYYPDGANSWTLKWNGRANVEYGRDITSPSTATSSPSVLTVTASAAGMRVGLTSTGITATVTFSGTTVSWSSSSFAADSPIAFQSSGTLPSPLVANTVYYVLSASLGANSFQIATTVGGSPITFSGGSGTHKGFGDWGRDFYLYETRYATNVANGEQWNPDYITAFSGFSPYRFMQMQNTYTGNRAASTVTFSGTTITWTGSGTIFGTGDIPNLGAVPGQTIMFQTTGTLPSPLVLGVPYYILAASLAVNSFQIATTAGGSPITFSGGSGTQTGITQVAMTASDLTPEHYIFWGGPSWNNQGGHALNGPPVEAMCNLCNALGADMWFNINPLAIAELSTAAATIALARLNSPHKVYVEMSNEIKFLDSANVPAWPQLGRALFPTSPNTNNDCFVFGVYQAMQHFAAWRTVFSGVTSRLVRTLGGAMGSDDYGNFICTLDPTTYGGLSSYWSSTPASHAEAYCIAPYMNGGEHIPNAWSTDGDFGVAKFYAEYAGNSGILPKTGDTSHTTSGTAPHFTVTSGQSLSSTPANGSIIYVKWNADYSAPIYTATFSGTTVTATASNFSAGDPVTFGTSIALPSPLIRANKVYYVLAASLTADSFQVATTVGGSAITFSGGGTGTHGVVGGATLAADGGTAYPLLDRIGHGFGIGLWTSFVTNDLQPLVFTSADYTGAVTDSGWRRQDAGYPGGYLQFGLTFARSAYDVVAVPNGLRCVAYEGGQTMSDFGQGDLVHSNANAICNASTSMGTLYTSYFTQMAATSGIDAFCHYADSGPPGDFGCWGALESVKQATSPKLTALRAFISGSSQTAPTPTGPKARRVVHYTRH